MKILFTAFAALLIFAACNKSVKDKATFTEKISEAPQDNKTYKTEAEPNDLVADTTTQQASPQGIPGKEKHQQKEPIPNPDWDKKIIKTADLDLEVKDYNTYYSAFREKVRSLGGYVAQEQQTQSDYKIENTLSIKIPVDQFDNAVSYLTNGVEKINERKISSQDVTTEVVDTKSRMEAKKQVRQRYMDLLNQARNMEEILNVQSEINSIQEEIESAAGRIEYLSHSASFSTINLTYYQVVNSSAKDNINSSPSFGKKVADSFKVGWNWVVDLLVGLVTIWPIFLAGFVLLVIYKRLRTAKPKQVS